MGDLLDGIRKLKERRQEATQAVTVMPDDMTGLITLYESIVTKSEPVQFKNSTVTDQDKHVLERMKKSFKYHWDELSPDKQQEFVDRLLDENLIPDTFGQILDVFDGSTVVSLVKV
jgi:hypothetical protein